MSRMRIFLLTTLVIILGSGAAHAAVWTVTKTANSSDGACNSDCSLREAVAAASAGDTIVFLPSVNGFVTLGGAEIVVTKNLTIDGMITPNTSVIVSGLETSRIFTVAGGAHLTLRNIKLFNGSVVNGVNGVGGAVFVKENSILETDRVAFHQNQADYGGALSADNSTLRLVNSSFYANSSKDCFAMQVNFATLQMANVTVSGNTQTGNTGVGAVCIIGATGNATIRNSTIANNTGGVNGGIAVINGSPELNIGNSIVAQNNATIANDLYMHQTASIVSAGGNLIGSLTNSAVPPGTFTLPGDQTGVNPLLAPTDISLTGSLVYHPLQAGSPAINSGIPALAVNPATNQPLVTDNRGNGFSRHVGGVDKGAFEDQTQGNALLVTKKTNSNDNVCDLDCSLREAVHAAGLDPGTETIRFHTAAIGTIDLGGSEIKISDQAVNIAGIPDYSQSIIISGGNASRIFYIDGVSSVTLSDLTLENGNGAGSAPNGGGGAIYAYAPTRSLTLDRIILRNNSAETFGAVFSQAEATRIFNSTIYNNRAANQTALSILSGALYMSNTTVSANFDSDGGSGAGALVIRESVAKIHNSTIAFNRNAQGSGGGLSCVFGCNLSIANTIVANNIADSAPDVFLFNNSVISSLGGNLVLDANGVPAGTFSQASDQTGVDPLLAALADNGGAVPTHALPPNSPAVNSGINSQAIDPFDNSVLTTDARGTGFLRFLGNVDKGSFEALAPTAAAVSVSGRVMNAKGQGIRATVYLTDAQGIVRSAKTNNFGYFRFETVAVGETYIATVFAKQYQFEPRVVTVTDELAELNFMPME